MMIIYIKFTMVWEERFFDHAVIRAKELSLKTHVDNIVVFSSLGIIPHQIDEVKQAKEYFEGDGEFGGEDEIVFPLRYCGEKVKIGSKFRYIFDHLFEVEAQDEKNNESGFCYIGIRKTEKGSHNNTDAREKADNEKETAQIEIEGQKLEEVPYEQMDTFKKGEHFIVIHGKRYAVFDAQKPVIRKIKMKEEGDSFKNIFNGLYAEIFIELLGLIEIRKTQEDISSRNIFTKAGKVRVIRVIRPYLDLGFGIKIPGSKVIGYIYPGFTYVENVVPIPFNLGMISRKAHANIYLQFDGAKRFVSEKNDIRLDSSTSSVINQENHMWGYVESEKWSVAYKGNNRYTNRKSTLFQAN